MDSVVDSVCCFAALHMFERGFTDVGEQFAGMTQIVVGTCGATIAW
jgi:hypothetical protein